MNTLTRDAFLKSLGIAGAGLALGFDLRVPPARAATGVLSPSFFVTIEPNDTVTVFSVKSEMGQGVLTLLPQLVAEELDFPFDAIKVAMAPVNAVNADPASKRQSTGGSTSIRDLYLPMRQAGATARAMLIAAAAQQWNVDPATVTTSQGSVVHADSGRRATYGSLAVAASALSVPADVPLKAPADFTVIGKSLARKDVAAKAHGTTIFGIDVRLPGMLYAMVARPPSFGGSVVSFDAAKARAVHGVVAVVQIPSGVAVLATNTYAARQGRDALAVKFAGGPHADQTTAKIFAEAAALAKKPGTTAKQTGDAPAALAAPHTVVRALYRGPFLAHATMEPMNATAWLHGGTLEVWTPTQGQSAALATAAKITGLDPGKVVINTTMLGGGFGRRSETDFTAEAVELAQKTAGKPVKVIWTREDDIRHDFYRPTSTNAVAAALDASGTIAGYQSTIVAPSIMRRFAPGARQTGFDRGTVNGVDNLVYDIANLSVDVHEHDTGVPVGFWRAPGVNWNAFVTESFMDELAHAAKTDPYQFRRKHLAGNARARAVLDRAAKLAGWDQPLPAGVHRGIAICLWNGSYAGVVAEITLTGNALRVKRLVASVDCGQIVNPEILTMQIESAAFYGLSAALNGKITIAKGAAVQSNFDDYPVLRIDRAPQIVVDLVQSSEAPTGAGEIGTPAVAPAIGNAIFSATGKRIRELPLSDSIKLA